MSVRNLHFPRQGGRSARVATRISRRGRRRSQVAAFTLVEMLVAMALSLIIILAVAQVFRLVGDNVVASRAMLEMSGQLRSAADQLQRDLGGVTVPVRPWPETTSDAGYFEYYEGPFWDQGLGSVPYTETSTGDIDDVLMFTARATGAPFVGQMMAAGISTTLESRVAEIAWFTRFNDRNRNGQPDPGEVTLHRRVLLIRPDLDLSDPTIQAMSPLQFYSTFDVSVRTTQIGPATWKRVPNSLNDLARRENRIAHDVSGAYPTYGGLATPNQPFPFPLRRELLVPQGSVVTPPPDDLTLPIDSPDVSTLVLPATAPDRTACAESFGSDLVLTNLLAFDVQAYDPTVEVRRAGSDPVLPSDPGYSVLPPGVPEVIGTGGYVDLGFSRYVAALPLPGFSVFSDPPAARSQLPPPTYDTWSLSYEQDGIDQDGNSVVDQGTNGFDDDGVNGVDDVGERETSPPYPVPLRGIQVRLRIIDRDTRQVRQMTVTSDFIPE